MKYCGHCGTEITDDAEICIKCDNAVETMANNQNSFKKTTSPISLSDILLLLFSLIIVFNVFFDYFVVKILKYWSRLPLIIFIYDALLITRWLSWLLPVLVIKDKLPKIIGIIMVIIPITYWIISFITFRLRVGF